jgi:hypothetical protein
MQATNFFIGSLFALTLSTDSVLSYRLTQFLTAFGCTPIIMAISSASKGVYKTPYTAHNLASVEAS